MMKTKAILAMLAAVLAVAGCSSTPPAKQASTASKGGYYLDDGPEANPPDNLDDVPDAVPRAEPLHRYANRTYTVMGNTYTPQAKPGGYSKEGAASWYGRRFHGKKTASGERYDMYAMTAAHPTLPIPSYARVTHLANGRSVIVRINDRGPFRRGRLIDLSYVAAAKLGLVGHGSGLVEVRAVLPGGSPAPAVITASASPGARALPTDAVYLQVGAFGEAAAAQRLASRLRGEALAPVSVQPANSDNRWLHRVRVGPLPQALVEQTVARLGALGLSALRLPAH
jgi:rare lipoprotein A